MLTPGNCEVEQWSLTADKKTVLFNSNCGDTDRRHIWRVGFDKSRPQPVTITKGIENPGIEWSPVARAIAGESKRKRVVPDWESWLSVDHVQVLVQIRKTRGPSTGVGAQDAR